MVQLYLLEDASFKPSELILVLATMFLAGCMVGYLLEVLFRRFITAHKWVNPGFMKGPWLPMYGFGLLIMFVICYLLYTFLPSDWTFYNPYGELYGRTGSSGPTVYDLAPLAIMSVGLIGLEFTAGLIFVKGFKVKLWDYSNLRGNILGIICPLFNLIWCAVAVLYYYLINPLVYRIFSDLFDYMFGADPHYWFIFLIGLIYGVFFIDLVDSLGVFTKIAKVAQESNIVTTYENVRNEQRKRNREARKKISEAMPAFLKASSEKNGKSAKEKIKEMAYKAVLIDPNKSSKPASNYDENGRPVKEENDKNGGE